MDSVSVVSAVLAVCGAAAAALFSYRVSSQCTGL